MDELEDLEQENNDLEPSQDSELHSEEDHEHKTIHLSGMYKNWFLDYASYVILERAVPDVKDGLKPVQRRILQSMKDLDDGRYNKVANIIGHTMQYHPHGDASIGDALVQLGQKELLIDCQGNWGNILTGDSAAASRYIEARLSKFAIEVVFNPKTTDWKASYDGRKKEPVALPLKFPLLLAQGVEGIAVGLASKILPHNFNELIDASIRILQGKSFELFPDFPTGGLADVSRYNDGIKGGRVRVRAKIQQLDKKNLVITEVPFGNTTSSLIDSIVIANDKGKIKIRKIDDNTADKVEIMIQLASNVSPDQTIDALYAFTNCEVSLSPNICVIDDVKPRFIGASEVLRLSTENTLQLLKMELEIRKAELNEQWHFSSLEKIFIEKRIYRRIEESETWEAVLETIDKGLKPYKKLFSRDITQDDIIRLTEIRIKRISKFNSFKADDIIKQIEAEIEEVNNHLEHLIDYAINYFRQIKKKYGKGKERKTEIRSFDTIQASRVAAATQKLYVNREEGFAGSSLRRDEFVCDCSDIDDIIVFREDGTYLITKVAPKVFIGRNVIHIDIFKRNDDRTIYNAIYRDGKRGPARVKRFAVKSITRDKEYTISRGTDDSKLLYFSANPNGEAEVIKVYLSPRPKLKKLTFEYDFSTLDIKGRGSQGNLLTKKNIRKIVKREEGVSTLGAIDIWFDDTVKRLNTEERGKYIGAFKSDDKILTIQKSGYYKLMSYELSNHFDEDMIFIGKHKATDVISAIYFDVTIERYYVKRFIIEDSNNLNKKIDFVGGQDGNTLMDFSFDFLPQVNLVFDPKKNNKVLDDELINVHEFIGLKSEKAKGKRVSNFILNKISFTDPLPYEKETMESADDEGSIDEVNPEVIREEEPSIPEPVIVEELKKTKAKPVRNKPEDEEQKAEKKKTEKKPKRKTEIKKIEGEAKKPKSNSDDSDDDDDEDPSKSQITLDF